MRRVNFQSFRKPFTIPPELGQYGSDPFISEKKNCSDYGVHGIQINRLGLTVPTQKSVLKNMYQVPRYYQESAQNRSTKPNQQKLTHFG